VLEDSAAGEPPDYLEDQWLKESLCYLLCLTCQPDHHGEELLVNLGKRSKLLAILVLLIASGSAYFWLRCILANHIDHKGMKKLTGSNPCLSFLPIQSDVNQFRKARVEVDVELCSVEGHCKFESALRIPFNEVLLLMKLRLLVINYLMSVTANLPEEIQDLRGYILPVDLRIVIPRLEHLLELEILSGLTSLRSLLLRLLILNVKEVTELR